MKFVVKTLYGLEQVLADELKFLGASEITKLNRAVAITGDKRLLYKVNYCSRTALSVLMTINEFRIKSVKDLYRKSIKVEWDRFLNCDMTFSVVTVINSGLFHHTGYPGLLLKDAIADWFSNKTGKRPSVNTIDPDIVFNLHISNDMVTLSVDSSVIPLYKRGYRKEQGIAPINEVLAAGIIYLSGWRPEKPFLDPMCGSGTFPVEAGLIASGIAPGKFRKFYGFQRWKDFDEELFQIVRQECVSDGNIEGIRIAASDISDHAVSFARANIEAAGLTDVISLHRSDFFDLKAVEDSGIIIMNPPYGKRMSNEDNQQLYSLIGSTLKHYFQGYDTWLITSDHDSLKHVGLKPQLKTSLFNGSLDCTLVKYNLYSGSKKVRSGLAI